MTQEELAGRCGVTQAMISGMETDRIRPSLETLELAARALDVQAPDMFEVEGEDRDLRLLISAVRQLSQNDRTLLLDLARRLLKSPS